MSEMWSRLLPLGHPRPAVLIWGVTVLLGCGISLAAWMALPSAITGMGDGERAAPFVMILALVIVAELRPIVMARQENDPVSISQAFIFAALYIWGPIPSLALMALAVLVGEVLARKAPWKIAFNVGNYALALAAAWLVLALGGWVVPIDLSALDAASIAWMILSWIVFHLVNIALVASLDSQTSFAASFAQDFWFYTLSTLAVLALSPLVAIVAIADAEAETWLVLPLLLLPLLAVQRTAQMSREREYRATHDPLTGLPNRELLTEQIEAALRAPKPEGNHLVLLVLDVDSFRTVNDGLGHGIGDSLLIDVSRRLSAAIRPGDTLARLGGDEFAIVCPSIPDREIEHLLTQISSALDEHFTCGTHEISLTASIGVAPATPGSTPAALLREADSAMYRAKHAGRNQAAHFHPAMLDQATALLDDQHSLRRALEREEVQVHFQPVVDLSSGRAVGFEALTRWNHPNRGTIWPHQFVGLAEETGLILPLGSWVLEHALGQLQSWRLEGPHAKELWVAVNLSPRQLTDPSLVDTVSRALAETAVPPDRLHLEITETAVMQSLEASNPVLDALRDLGVHLAIDDFGMGYSSLHRLKRLPVTALKVDRSFVAGLGRDESDRSIIEAIVNMADSLGLDVIAEGVETPEQREILRALGARLGQGYLWSRALPAASVTTWLRAPAAVGQLAAVRDLGDARQG